MAAITNDQSKSWKQEAIDRAAVVSDRWDVLMAWLAHFAVPVLTISMFVSIASMFPGVHFWDWASSSLLILQVIFLDIGGMALKPLASQAQDKGQARAAEKGRKMSNFLIGLLITTLVIVAVNQLAPIAGPYATNVKQATSYIDIGLILVRVVSIVLYLNVVHDLKEHAALSIQPTQPPTQSPIQPIQEPIQSEKVVQLEQTVNTLQSQLLAAIEAMKGASPTQPIQPPTQVREEPTHEFGALMAGMSIITDIAKFATGVPIVEADSKPSQAVIAERASSISPEHEILPVENTVEASAALPVYPIVQGVSAEKVKQLITLFESGTTWRSMPGNYSQTIKPVRDAYESLHASTH